MKKIIFLLSFLIFSLSNPLVFASSKMLIETNTNVVLNGESDLKDPDYNWILLKDDEIITKKNGKQFAYLFEVTGSYLLNLEVESKKTQEKEKTHLNLLVGEGQKFIDSLLLKYKSFPQAKEDKIYLLDNKISFLLKESQGNIFEYQIDANLQFDSDQDGDSSNDVDNIEDNSLNDGSLWSYKYDKDTKFPVKAKLTIKDVEGNEDSKILTIYQEKDKNQELKAVLETYPANSSEKKILLTGDKQTVYLYAGNSSGDIKYYLIDTNIKEDSDADLKTDNDIDNKNHPSFKTGEVFPLNLERVNGDRIVQLIVVDDKKQGSLVQKKFVWDTSKKILHTNNFRLFSDKDRVTVGDIVHFGIEGIKENSGFEIKWDFNEDQEADFVSETNLASYQFQTSGTYEVLAQIKNKEEKILKYAKKKIKVLDKSLDLYNTKKPFIDFSYQIDKNKVKFINKSSADKDLEDKSLEYFWQFGDGYSSKEKNPQHTYKKEGEYIVRLKITDQAKNTNKLQKIIKILEVVLNISDEDNKNEDKDLNQEENQEEDKNKTDNKDDNKDLDQEEKDTEKKLDLPELNSSIFLKVLMYGFIGIVVFIILFLIYFIYLKIKYPDYTFSEIFEEEKEKILSLIEGRDYHEPNGEILATEKEVKDKTQKILNSSTEKEDKNKEKKEENKEKKLNSSKEEKEEKKEKILEKKPEKKEETILDDKKDDKLKDNEDDGIPDWLK